MRYQGGTKVDINKTLDAMRYFWCTDNESGQQMLIDLQTNEILARKNEKGEIVYANNERISR
jgi:hypothetical protein